MSRESGFYFHGLKSRISSERRELPSIILFVEWISRFHRRLIQNGLRPIKIERLVQLRLVRRNRSRPTTFDPAYRDPLEMDYSPLRGASSSERAASSNL